MKKLLSALFLAILFASPVSVMLAVSAPTPAYAEDEAAVPADAESAALADDAALGAQAEEPAAVAAPQSLTDRIADQYQKGGWVMHVIALAFAFGLAITIERVYYLYFKAKANKHQFLAQIVADINANRLDKAIDFAGKSQSPLAKIIKAGLESAKAGQQDPSEAMDQASLANVPFLERNTPYLAMIGNVATLLGLLGTILGLIGAFGATAYADPSQKATMLSLSISEAMNTTAFGLMTAIPVLVAFAVLNGKTQRIIEDIQEASSIVVSKLNKQKKA